MRTKVFSGDALGVFSALDSTRIAPREGTAKGGVGKSYGTAMVLTVLKLMQELKQ